jgi:hypothetical protein
VIQFLLLVRYGRVEIDPRPPASKKARFSAYSLCFATISLARFGTLEHLNLQPLHFGPPWHSTYYTKADLLCIVNKTLNCRCCDLLNIQMICMDPRHLPTSKSRMMIVVLRQVFRKLVRAFQTTARGNPKDEITTVDRGNAPLRNPSAIRSPS